MSAERATWSAKTIHAWFQDRYEWHPVLPGLYAKHADDMVRERNCVRVALVELKSGGAADYWMKGEATIPLAVLATPATAPPPKEKPSKESKAKSESGGSL